MNPLDMALIQLEGLIAGIESNSSIPIQASELKMIKMFIQMAQQGEALKMRES